MKIEKHIQELERELLKIKARNERVEKDKSWETSTVRKLAIASVTYIFMTIFMFSIKVESPLINAIIPTLGFLLSTLSLSFIRRLWERN